MDKYSENNIVVPNFCEANGFYTTKQRSKLMQKIKSQDTKPELRLKKELWKLGLRYRKNLKKLPGCPDIVFIKWKIAIFVDGEFWHGYNWELKKERIKVNRDFWIPKIERNIQRDKNNDQLLKDEGWKVLRFWESDLKRDLDGCVDKIFHIVHGQE